METWTYDRFEVGQVFGTQFIVIDEPRREMARAIYSDDPRGEGETLLVASMMKAYIDAIQPRPPGNVHIGQTLAFVGELPSDGSLEFEVICAGKELRGDTRRVTFGVNARHAGQLVMAGEILTIWAL